MPTVKPSKPAADYPTEDSSQRFPLDSELREAGFRIASRPARGPAVWERGGKRYPQADALRLARQ